VALTIAGRVIDTPLRIWQDYASRTREAADYLHPSDVSAQTAASGAVHLRAGERILDRHCGPFG